MELIDSGVWIEGVIEKGWISARNPQADAKYFSMDVHIRVSIGGAGEGSVKNLDFAGSNPAYAANW